MPNYTEHMEDALNNEIDGIDDYEAKTRDFLSREESNRTFGQALIDFMAEHCDFANGSDPVQFIKESCKKNNVNDTDIAKDRRTYQGWFSGSKRIGRRNQLFALAFGLGLDTEQTKALFHKVYLDRSFDFRNSREIIYYYCMNRKKSWNEAKVLIDALPSGIADQDDDRTLATQYIKSGIDDIENDEELQSYIARHNHNLSLKNVTARKNLEMQMSAAKVFALEEATEIKTGDERILWDRYKGYDTQSNSFLYYVVTDQSAVGDKGTKTVFTKAIKERFNSGVFRCFPEVKSLSGKDLSYEEMRKALILLFSYLFWSRAKEKNMHAYKLYDDYRLQLDDLLLESGMPPLYPGNPFDWLFLCCTLEQEPLNSFRTVIGDILEPDED